MRTVLEYFENFFLSLWAGIVGGLVVYYAVTTELKSACKATYVIYLVIILLIAIIFGSIPVLVSALFKRAKKKI